MPNLRMGPSCIDKEHSACQVREWKGYGDNGVVIIGSIGPSRAAAT